LRSGAYPRIRCATSSSRLSRHLVKFVEADGLLWAVKDMPARVAAKEYDVLRRLEEMGGRPCVGTSPAWTSVRGNPRSCAVTCRPIRPNPTREEGHDVDEATSALLWVIEVLTPYERRAHDVGHHTGTNRALAALAATSSAPLPVLRDD
jgi:hypothetical protein